jgi:hypothetical protein
MKANTTNTVPNDFNPFAVLSINQMKAKRLSITKLVNDSNDNLYYTVYTFDSYFVIRDRHERMYIVSNASLEKLTFDNIDLLVCSL